MCVCYECTCLHLKLHHSVVCFGVYLISIFDTHTHTHTHACTHTHTHTHTHTLTHTHTHTHSHTHSHTPGTGLSWMSVQFGFLSYLVFLEYDWDIMEPVTYFVGYGTSILLFSYYILTRQVCLVLYNTTGLYNYMMLCTMNGIYSGTALIRTPVGQEKVSLLVRCPHWRKSGTWGGKRCPV